MEEGNDIVKALNKYKKEKGHCELQKNYTGEVVEDIILKSREVLTKIITNLIAD